MNIMTVLITVIAIAITAIAVVIVYLGVINAKMLKIAKPFWDMIPEMAKQMKSEMDSLTSEEEGD